LGQRWLHKYDGVREGDDQGWSKFVDASVAVSADVIMANDNGT